MKRTRGFTMIELMIVVAVLVILSVISITSYKRYMARARVTEVYAMFAEIRAKEEAYRAEYGVYLTIGTGETDLFPAPISGGEPVPKNWTPATTGAQAAWGFLGIRPPANQVWCGYNVMAQAASSFGATGTFVRNFIPTAPQVNWWVAIAMCDNDNTPGALSWGSPNAKFITSSMTTAIRDENITR